MIDEDPQTRSVKRLNQTKISSYFTGCSKSIPLSKKSPTKRKGSSNVRKKLSFSSSMASVKTELTKKGIRTASTSTGISPENLSLIAKIPKRKLPAAIFSEDENSDSENCSRRSSQNNSPTKQMKISISINQQTGVIPSQKTCVEWRPFMTSSPPVNTPHEQTSSCTRTNSEDSNNSTNGLPSNISPQRETPSCSKAKPVDLNNSKESPKPIRVIQNVVLQSPSKSQQKSKNVKDETKKVNYEQLRVMREFFINVLKNNYLAGLLSASDKDFLHKFYNMNKEYQYVCVKLFLWKPLWYNIFKFVEQIGLSMADSEIITMYNFLNDNGFVDVDYMSEDLFTLLDVLSLKDVRDIGRSFKLPNVGGNKETVISKLIKTCKTQTTLTTVFNTEGILKERIKEKMGFCVKLSARAQKCLFSVFLLNTFTNSSLVDPQEYFKQVSYFNVVFPDYDVENFHIFYTPQEFLRYAESVKLRIEMDKALKNRNVIHIFEICKCAYNMLKELNDENNNIFDSSRQPHLERFTPNAKYISILSSGCKLITTQYYNDVLIWYEYLISQGYCNHKRGEWYCQLTLIYTQYIKNYEKAAKLLIKALKEEKKYFSDIQLQELAHRGRMLNKKTYNLAALFHDEIAALSPPSCDRSWPQDVLECKSIQSEESGKKRVYVRQCENGDVDYSSVEQTALDYYQVMGFPNGEHCEGRLIVAAFCLLFWDIIYENYVKGTFVSRVQNVPLDMYTEHFYNNREQVIKKRLSAISTKWTDETLKKRIVTNWDKHSHESSLCEIDSCDGGPQYLFDIILCIGRPILSKIFERLVKNYRIYNSGFPDLILWNSKERKAKFVEVKSEHDKLSIKQKLWLNYLIEIGASVAVCHIEPKSSKKKLHVTKK